MIDPPKVAVARIEAARRRGELLGTVHELQARLAPRTLASDAWAKARNKGADMAEDAVDAVKARPVAVGGAAAALGLFLARRPIADAAVKLYDALTSGGETKADPPALNTKQKPRSTPRPDGDVR